MRWRRAGTTAWTNGPPFDVPNPVTDASWSQDATGLSGGADYEYQACGKEASDSAYACAGPDGTGNTVGTFRTTGGVTRQPPGFTESTVFSGLTEPMTLRFAPDGRVFVAEKSGLVKVFDSLADSTPTVFADLRTKVHNFWDRGLLGLALDPAFPTQPYVYVLYAHDAAIGGTAPRWGTAGATSDGCPTPPGPTTDGCVVSGRLSRLQAAGNSMTGAERVLIEDWCSQFPSHAVGDLEFGPDGGLYVSGGDGASFGSVDYGQFGSPRNPCGDPPAGTGGTQTPPGAEGGALRSQSPRRPADEPRVLDGAVLRVDRATGAGLAGNPLAASSDANARRIVAYGLRNPFRFAVRPGTSEVWVGDVGWSNIEEINRLVSPTGPSAANFGWPCYEGSGRQAGYDAVGLSLCEGLYAQAGAVTAPFHSYRHADKVAGESCPSGSSSISGLDFVFYPGGPYPADYDGALFFADYSRDCIWAMIRGGSSLPSPSKIRTFVAGAAAPVDVRIGPGGDLFYVDFDGGTVRRVRYTGGNQAPTAVARATPTSGDVPLTVSFDASASSDPDPGDTLRYSWDLDANGTYDDSTAIRPTFTYATAGVRRVGLRVTDSRGATGSASVTVTAGNTPPTASIAQPSTGLTWAVGDRIAFSGSATDAQDGTLPSSALSWSVILDHCPSTCHTHPLRDFPGVASGSFDAPDHEYPSHLTLRLTATDSSGMQSTASVRLDPRTVTVTLQSSPSGLQLALNGQTATAPFTRSVILGARNTLIAPLSQTLSGQTYGFRSWSDNGAATHSVTASASATYTATYKRR
jgi:glucose/arabinose dehydrogenase